jgi:hypothetical protein
VSALRAARHPLAEWALTASVTASYGNAMPVNGYEAVSLTHDSAHELRLLAIHVSKVVGRRVSMSTAIMVMSEVISDLDDEVIKQAGKVFVK